MEYIIITTVYYYRPGARSWSEMKIVQRRQTFLGALVKNTNNSYVELKASGADFNREK